ncbi:rod shape-determining protein MreC [Photobacterium sp. WH77]|uniref:Cell shape-determining protein MreC n=2 Tax=Photobacterium TaxID=657 RepID=A0A7X4Y374_9GAMM|nr:MULTISPECIES: rod shape-determining protein MreC [Photobacterium]MBD8513126.1 rod shape-determining protein MreC [Photobacterium arenosum]MBV7262060.1 rod shape-determining protein MreC [Photobacterium sp. WH24]MCG2836548.1 rod shape-determining protein MreC [Photobacterium sp. WH77]MCG2844325.1 rod shape-determining protein MreC [Photobacterium sp. WH80]MDO6581927.1 rod shape-determining protein MreC [Photobacterium sp. 2_MG-2023]
MKPIFGRGPSLQLRLFLAMLLSAGLMLADSRLDAFAQVRYVLNSAVAPLQYAANLPREILDGLFSQLSSHQRLLAENKALKRDLLVLQSDVLLLDQLQQENQRLRELLGSPFVRDERKMVAEVMAVDSDPYSHQVMIDKGRVDGVYEGQPVINDKGIVGQISYVGAHNSRVLLLIDPTHAIPVQVVRNDIRVIASGSGEQDQIQLEHVPSSTDIKVGDLLVTSGLGGRYPEGYPVGRVTEFSFDNKRPFAQIKALPTVQFDRLRYLLLVWPTDRERHTVTTGDPVNG